MEQNQDKAQEGQEQKTGANEGMVGQDNSGPATGTELPGTMPGQPAYGNTAGNAASEENTSGRMDEEEAAPAPDDEDGSDDDTDDDDDM